MAGEKRDVLPALAQGRQRHRDDVQAIEEVLPEGPLVDHPLQIAVGGGDQPDVRLDRARGADPLELPLLQDAQQQSLERQRNLAHLVEEQGAPLGRLDLADLAFDRSRESPSLVAEERALEERLGERGAVDRHERLAGPQAAAVEGARGELLAGAALAAQQDGRVGRGDAREEPLGLPDRRALAHHPGVQRALDPLLLLFQRLQMADVGERRRGDAGRGRRQLQMALVETGSRLAGVQVEDAERPIPADQRSGEERLETRRVHALDALPAVALERVVRRARPSARPRRARSPCGRRGRARSGPGGPARRRR